MKFETLVVIAATAIQANAHSGHHMSKLMQASPETNAAQAFTFTNKVDHFDTMQETIPETYQQRYWMNTDHWDKSSGPVFVYICGEWVCSAPDVYQLPFQVAAQVGANMISIEHRYYGESQPFTDLTVESMEYLSSELALADLAYFIDAMNDQWEQDPEIGRRPEWITVGGSYPGALSAWFKSQYPNHALGAWSSSGVIHSIVDFSDFDNSIYTSTSKSGEDCPAIIKSHYEFLEEAYTNEDYLEQVCKAFGISIEDCSSLTDKPEFFFYVADIYTIGVQYGNRTGLCDMLIDNKDEEMITQLTAAQQFGTNAGVSWPDYDADVLANTDMNTSGVGRQWTYQYCTEFGFYQIPNVNFALRSQYIDSSFWPEYCDRIFGTDRPSEHSSETNEHYGGLDIPGDHIVFVNAVEDPWQWAGMRNIHNETTQSGMDAFLVDCDDCAHCIDLHGPYEGQPTSLTQVQEKVTEIVVGWVQEAKMKQYLKD